MGGSYGSSNEFDMMVEIEQNGPIVVNFRADESFETYQQGIYAGQDYAGWVYEGKKQPEF